MKVLTLIKNFAFLCLNVKIIIGTLLVVMHYAIKGSFIGGRIAGKFGKACMDEARIAWADYKKRKKARKMYKAILKKKIEREVEDDIERISDLI